MNFSFSKVVIPFIKPSGTSRGVLYNKTSWIIEVVHNGRLGKGECSVIPDLSPDYTNDQDYEQKLNQLIDELSKGSFSLDEVYTFLKNGEYSFLNFDLRENPSILFGLETAVFNLKHGADIVFENSFSKGELSIPINGLIWMSDEASMKHQIDEKIKLGFNCIKMKIGAIDFEQEIKLLKYIRSFFSKEQMILRVDANGAFSYDEAPKRLQRLSELDLHSIEQPIKAGNWREMAELCRETPLDIALDEELIGINHYQQKIDLLDTIHPQYIILKPSLHGGFYGCQEWIQLATDRKIDFWITSALEFNIGLNAIAQFTAQFSLNSHHGLGTGALYVRNFDSNLYVDKGFLSYKITCS